MDAFDNFDENLEEKKKFINRYNHNQKILRNVMGFVYIGIGIFFILLGVGLYFVLDLMLYVIGGIGLLFLILGIIFYFTLGKMDANKTYNRYQERIRLGKPIYSTYEMQSRILMLESRVKHLEEELERIKRM